MLETWFKLRRHGTTVRTEGPAGVSTFLTMVYIVFVNPQILAITGMDPGAANYPIALAPGMGLNAYFAFTVVAAGGNGAGLRHGGCAAVHRLRDGARPFGTGLARCDGVCASGGRRAGHAAHLLDRHRSRPRFHHLRWHQACGRPRDVSLPVVAIAMLFGLKFALD